MQRGYETTYLTEMADRRGVAKMWSEDLKTPYSYVKHINFLGKKESSDPILLMKNDFALFGCRSAALELLYDLHHLWLCDIFYTRPGIGHLDKIGHMVFFNDIGKLKKAKIM